MQKKAILSKLGVKAELRNPDEFYHKMNSAKLVDGEHRITLKTNQEKAVKLQERQNLALINLSRMAQAKKAEKLKSNLHMIDFVANQGTHVKFVEDFQDIKKMSKRLAAEEAAPAEEPTAAELGVGKLKSKKSDIDQQVLQIQSENKQQYKKLADALQKTKQYTRVQEALTFDKHMKDKGKKRKIDESDNQQSGLYLHDDSSKGKCFFTFFK